MLLNQVHCIKLDFVSGGAAGDYVDAVPVRLFLFAGCRPTKLLSVFFVVGWEGGS